MKTQIFKFTSEILVHDIDIINVTPYKFDIDSNNVQTFQITCSSYFGDDFIIILFEENSINRIRLNCIKKNSTNIECSFLFKFKNVYRIQMNSHFSNFKLYAGVEVNETNNNTDESNSNYQNNINEKDDNGIFYKFSFKMFTILCFLLFL